MQDLTRARWSRRLWIIYALAMTAGCFAWSTAWELTRCDRDAWAARALAAEAKLAPGGPATPAPPKGYSF